MHRSQRAAATGPLVVIALAAAFYLFWLRPSGDATAATTALTAGASGGSTHGHSGVNSHAANVQSFADRHVEAQIAPRSGTVRVYFYGEREKQLLPVPALGLEMEVLPAGQDAIPVTLTARPYPGETPDNASRYEGKFAPTGGGMETGAALTVPYAGRVYRVQWRPEHLMGAGVAHENGSGTHDGSDGGVAMPAPLAGADAGSGDRAQPTEAERALFLTPGGIYTAADIAANGNTVAALKYRGQMASHDMNPKPGAALCPITNTAANPRFTWVVAGKTYKFCCPPCVEEFVKLAKTNPKAVKDPEAYVKN